MAGPEPKPSMGLALRPMSHVVVAELVANVLSVEVVAGQRVEAVQAVVVLESMKMEIPVLAEVAGTVTEVNVAVGDVIQAGHLIAVID